MQGLARAAPRSPVRHDPARRGTTNRLGRGPGFQQVAPPPP